MAATYDARRRGLSEALPIQLAPPASVAPRDEATAAFHAWIRSWGSQELADWNEALSRIPLKGGS